MQLSARVLGQLFLFVCVLATVGIAAILFILFGPVPQKRSVVIVPRMVAPAITAAPVAAPSLVAQLAPVPNTFFTPPQPIQAAPQTSFDPLPAAQAPAHAVAPPSPPRKPKGGKVQPLPRKRIAKGTDSPFAPVVRSRQFRDEDVATSPVPLFEAEAATVPAAMPRRVYEAEVATTPRRVFETEAATITRSRMFETEAATIQRNGFNFDSGEHTTVDES